MTAWASMIIRRPMSGDTKMGTHRALPDNLTVLPEKLQLHPEYASTALNLKRGKLKVKTSERCLEDCSHHSIQGLSRVCQPR
ncbi:hypothetical protein GCM10025859_14590 [Alicyclobacillus fastidiosus]|nr:hypothetical protein GCM10025859_14590 [Alicyclobacillus fastidiosus]